MGVTMENYAYFETINESKVRSEGYTGEIDSQGYKQVKINTKDAYKLNMSKVLEALLLNERVIISGKEIDMTLDVLLKYFSSHELNNLITRKIIQFSFENIPYSFNQLHMKTNMIFRINPIEGKYDLEKKLSEDLRREKYSTRELIKLRKNILDNSIINSTKDVVCSKQFLPLIMDLNKATEYQLDKMFVDKFLNDFAKTAEVQDLYSDLFKLLYPYNIYQNYLSAEIKIYVDDNGIFLDYNKKIDEYEVKQYSGIIGGSIIPFMLNNFISTSVSQKNQCWSYYGAEDFVRWQTNLVEESHTNRFEKLLYRCNCPNISEITSYENHNRIINQRNDMINFRKFYFNYRDLSLDELERKYNQLIQSEEKKKAFNGKISSVGIATLGYFLDPTISFLLAMADIYAKDPLSNISNHILKKYQTIRLDNIF